MIPVESGVETKRKHNTMQTEPEKGEEIGVNLPYTGRIMVIITSATQDSMDTGTL